MTRAEELAYYCRMFNMAQGRMYTMYLIHLLALEQFGKAKLKKMYVPAWKRKIILAAWYDGELVYDRREDG